MGRFHSFISRTSDDATFTNWNDAPSPAICENTAYRNPWGMSNSTTPFSSAVSSCLGSDTHG